MSDSDI